MVFSVVYFGLLDCLRFLHNVRPVKYGVLCPLNELSNFILTSKYLRYDWNKQRRETYEEAVSRVLGMHEPRLGSRECKRIEPFLLNKTVMPSMRTLQFGGVAVEQHNMRAYNCVGMVIRPDELPIDLAKYLYCLMCGSGVGVKLFGPNEKISVPKYKPFTKTAPYTVPDTIVGWCDAVWFTLTGLLTSGVDIPMDYSGIRPKGSAIRTGGGLAPGHEPLERAIENIKKRIIDSEYLTSLDVYDLCMFLSEAVLSGGVRRAATMALFDPTDKAMVTAKTGDWLYENPQRQYSNNSAQLVREETDKDTFHKFFESTREYGEPGVVFTKDQYHTTNPCAEITFEPYWYGQPGLQTCNLTTINASKVLSPEEFLQACRVATILGTVQATYTDFRRPSEGYVTTVDEAIVKRDALLGVSICGILDNPRLLSPQTLAAGASLSLQTNATYAAKLGINTAKRICTVKPEGTASLVLGSSSGIHARAAEKYFRRVEVKPNDPVANHLLQTNPDLDDGPARYKPETNLLKFPVVSPPTAKIKADISAKEFLEMVLTVKHNWCMVGSRDQESHNVSNTIHVKETEWEELEDEIWKNRKYLTGISLVPNTGDTVYPQAPEERVTEQTQEEFDRIRTNLKPTDYTTLKEHTDVTEQQHEFACVGGACEI